MKDWKSKQFNMDKGLVQKVLDLYFKYCELDLPFKIGDEYEIHEFSVEYMSKRSIGLHDYYRCYKTPKVQLDEFVLHDTYLHFHWDELVDFELTFTQKNPRGITQHIKTIGLEVVCLERLHVTENIQQIRFTYTVNTEQLELTVYKNN